MEKINNIFAKLKERGVISISTDDFYAEIQDLTADLIFLKELTSRMKKSRFDFTCIPTFDRNINGIFLKKLWSNAMCRGWSTNADTVNLLLKIYYIVEGFFKILDSEDSLSADDSLMIRDLEEILYEEFLITLSDESSNFIGCSSSCRGVVSKLRRLRLK